MQYLFICPENTKWITTLNIKNEFLIVFKFYYMHCIYIWLNSPECSNPLFSSYVKKSYVDSTLVKCVENHSDIFMIGQT